jgi:acetolactate synthase-1/2/3 large subunit
LEEQIERAAHLLAQARRPIIMAGNGAVRAHAGEALVAFAEKLNIPVATTFMGKGIVSDRHPLAQGAIGMQAPDHINRAFAQCDLVITVGYDLVEYAPSLWNPAHDKTIIHVDSSPAEVDSAYIVGVGVVGGLSTSLRELARICRPQAEMSHLTVREELERELEQHRDDASFPLKPQRIISDLRRALQDEDIVISDVGAHKVWLARLFPCYQPNTCLISNGFAAMGIAVPGAVAAKLVFPNRRVVAVTGDGGFLMNSQELETAVRLGTGFVVLVLNDQTYGLIKWKQMNRFARPAFTDFGNPDFVKYAESFGAQAWRVQAAGELQPALQAALASDRVTLIDCPVDFGENLKLSERLSALAKSG